MSEEFESVEEIKSRLEAESKDKAPKVEDAAEQESKDIVNNEEQPKLSLSQRLDNAYQNLDADEKEAWDNFNWRPKDLFKGKNRDGSERKWIPAKEFLDKGKRILPIANERMERMAKELEETKKIAKEAQARIAKAEETGYQKAMKDLEIKQVEAVEIGDVEEFNKLKQSEKDLINSLKTEVSQNDTVVEDVMKHEPVAKVGSSTLSPLDQQILQDWAAKNDWMRTDPKLAGYAVASEKQLLDLKPYLSLNERLQLVEEEVKKVFYTKFNPTQQNNAMFESGSNKGFGSSPKSKGYSDLSPEVKNQCETLIKIRGIQGEDEIKRFRANYAKNIN